MRILAENLSFHGRVHATNKAAWEKPRFQDCTEISFANPDVVIIFDINSSKHSTDVKSHGHFQGVIISDFIWGFGKTLVSLDFSLGWQQRLGSI